MENKKEATFDVNDKLDMQNDAIREVRPSDAGEVLRGAPEDRVQDIEAPQRFLRQEVWAQLALHRR